VAINLIASDNRANIMQRPRIQTSHAVPGTFFIGDSVPYASTDYGGYGYGGVSGYNRSSVQYLEVGTTLDVTPFITPDGLVVLDIVQEISSFDGFEQITTDTKGPKSSTKSASATLSIRDGDTILLGGYISESKSKTKSGVPVLKDIPLLGTLFRSKSTDNSRSELVILLHVTVLKTPADAGIQAQAEKSATIRAAEREFADDELKRRKKLEEEELHKKKR
jgi:general secretion pathway protein D